MPQMRRDVNGFILWSLRRSMDKQVRFELEFILFGCRISLK